ncbi:hypothetical protein M422DRAFT_50719 [Sphaerobolus stellatus SS14]|uniref:Uncharacterized protein n=1 Tax=Sphaerobolus stellatus (strain SS14) TaxID=990650 RepID=A0A0C9VIG3_SPHS4|nr:hypothetical protein M422DRAFT_50719 [Sphaerobolus stellatus SS14]
MDNSERKLFDEFCNALGRYHSKWGRFVARPQIEIKEDNEVFCYNLSVCKRRRGFKNKNMVNNHWSIWLKGLYLRENSTALEQSFLYLFELHYAGIPIEPIVKVTESVKGLFNQLPKDHGDAKEAQEFNQKIVEAVRELVLGNPNRFIAASEEHHQISNPTMSNGHRWSQTSWTILWRKRVK